VLVELSVMEQRYQAVLEVVSSLLPVTEVAARYGVSRQTVYAWLARYEADGLPGLVDGSHRPRHHPGQLEDRVAALVCELRRAHPRWGPRRLRHELGGPRGVAGAVTVHGVSGAGPGASGRGPAAATVTGVVSAVGASSTDGFVAAGCDRVGVAGRWHRAEGGHRRG
jgi:transposase